MRGRRVDTRERKAVSVLRSLEGWSLYEIAVVPPRERRLALALVTASAPTPVRAQGRKGKPPAPAAAAPAPQKMDEEYTRLIKEYLQDPRITTELVDHMPASDTVPSPLKFLGRIPGKPGELTYAKDIYRYYEALAKASPRAKFWKIGQTEEGRDQVILAIADEATIKDLDKYKDILAKLGDPRKITDDQAKRAYQDRQATVLGNSGIHSPETGGPEMLIELAYRLIVEETPFIQQIRNNVITFITPVIEVDGREKEVDTYYFNKKLPQGSDAPAADVLGQVRAARQQSRRHGAVPEDHPELHAGVLEWHPTVLHDLHEAQSYLYVPPARARITRRSTRSPIDEWWLLAQTEVMEMAKRGVPGVFTYGFYDGWVPNYLFWIALTHNSFGRFYEVQSYGPDVKPNLHLSATQTSREWFRPNPPLPSIKWGPRNNTNIQESALLLAFEQGGEGQELYLENYWIKNKRAIDKGKDGPTYALAGAGGTAAQGGRGRPGERTQAAGRGGASRHAAPSRRATWMWRKAITSSAETSLIARSLTCTSASRTIRRPTRGRTTTRAGRCSICAMSS